jgi:hypothetical protein
VPGEFHNFHLEGLTVLGCRKGLTVLGRRKGLTASGCRKGLTASGCRKGLMASGCSFHCHHARGVRDEKAVCLHSRLKGVMVLDRSFHRREKVVCLH